MTVCAVEVDPNDPPEGEAEDYDEWPEDDE
jgi:hypothetical protein